MWVAASFLYKPVLALLFKQQPGCIKWCESKYKHIIQPGKACLQILDKVNEYKFENRVGRYSVSCLAIYFIMNDPCNTENSVKPWNSLLTLLDSAGLWSPCDYHWGWITLMSQMSQNLIWRFWDIVCLFFDHLLLHCFAFLMSCSVTERSLWFNLALTI